MSEKSSNGMPSLPPQMRAPKGTPMRLVMDAGLIPEEVISQMVDWRFLSEEEAGTPSSREAMSELVWEGPDAFIRMLGRALEKQEMEVRETDFTVAGDLSSVTLVYGGVAGEIRRSEHRVLDKWNRLYLPPGEEYVDNLSVVLVEGKTFRVEQDEMRYRGSEPCSRVLYLEEVEHETSC